MREAFIEKRFNQSSRAIMDNAALIIEEHKGKGHKLALRQLYYEFVRRGLVKNSAKEYKRVGKTINEGRLAGVIDWNALDDRTRFLRAIPSYPDLSAFAQDDQQRFALNLWADQPNYCEVWIEKETILGSVESVCFRYRVPVFVCRGYVPQAYLYDAGSRFHEILMKGHSVTVFHFGDFDRPGVDMARDNTERLRMFARSADVRVAQLAITQEQIQRFQLPHDPLKADEWEIESLPTVEIERCIVSAIGDILDNNKFSQAILTEKELRSELAAINER